MAREKNTTEIEVFCILILFAYQCCLLWWSTCCSDDEYSIINKGDRKKNRKRYVKRNPHPSACLKFLSMQNKANHVVIARAQKTDFTNDRTDDLIYCQHDKKSNSSLIIKWQTIKTRCSFVRCVCMHVSGNRKTRTEKLQISNNKKQMIFFCAEACVWNYVKVKRVIYIRTVAVATMKCKRDELAFISFSYRRIVLHIASKKANFSVVFGLHSCSVLEIMCTQMWETAWVSVAFHQFYFRCVAFSSVIVIVVVFVWSQKLLHMQISYGINC